MVALDKTAVDTRSRSSLKQQYGKITGDAHIRAHLQPPDDPTRDRIVAVIPAYNEARFIGSVVLQTLRYAGTVIVVDDGSSDHTAVVAQSAGAVVVRHNHNQGKGAALNTGFQFAGEHQSEVVVTLDADGQHRPEDLRAVVEPILAGKADFVIGSRYLEQTSAVPRHRIWGHWLFNLMTRLASGITSTDSQSGYRAFSPPALINTRFSSEGFSVESEMQFIAKEHDLRMVEIPITIHYPEKPKRSVIAHGLVVLNGVLRLVGQYRPLLFFGVPGMVLLFVGLIWGWAVVDIHARTDQLAVGYAMLSVLFAILGSLGLVTGIILHSTRGLLHDMFNKRIR